MTDKEYKRFIAAIIWMVFIIGLIVGVAITAIIGSALLLQ